MSRSELSSASLREFNSVFLADKKIQAKYQLAKEDWLVDLLDDEDYRYPLFFGACTATAGLMYVAKRTETKACRAADHMVTTYDLRTADSQQLTIGEYMRDAKSSLWLRVVDWGDIANWPAGKNPQYYKPPYAQTRIELDFDEDDMARNARYTKGLAKAAVYANLLALDPALEIAVNQSRLARLDLVPAA